MPPFPFNAFQLPLQLLADSCHTNTMRTTRKLVSTKPTLALTSKSMYCKKKLRPCLSVTPNLLTFEPSLLYLPHQLQDLKRSILAFLLLLLADNGFFVFYLHLPFLAKPFLVLANFSPVNTVGELVRKLSFSSSKLASSLSLLFCSCFFFNWRIFLYP